MKIIHLFIAGLMLVSLTACDRVTRGAALHRPDPTIPQGLYAHGINFMDIVVSPNGEQIAFEYVNEPTGRGVMGLGIYEPKTGKLTRIPVPAGKQFTMPSFSPDGQRLLVVQGNRGTVYGNQIAEIDLRTMHAKDITAPADGPIFYPVYQPNTGSILYWNDWMRLSHGLMLLNPVSLTQQEILNWKNGFNRVKSPFFVGTNTIVFQATGRGGQEGADDRQAANNVSGLIAYRMNLGAAPQMVSIEAERDRHTLDSAAFNNLSATHDGRAIVFTSTRATPHKGKVVQELYKLESGSITQLTSFGQYVRDAYVAANGQIIAFVADATPDKAFDVFVYDARTGKAAITGLRSAIASSQAFALEPRAY